MDRRAFLMRGSLGAAGVVAGAGGGTVLRAAQDRGAKEAAERDGRGRGSTRLVYSFAATERLAALTFDDGPHPRLTPPLLDMLAAHQAAATFFLVGRAAADHPGVVERQVAEGHEIGNHTWSHPRMSDLTGAAVREEVARGARALTEQTGRRPRWFRSPRGVITGPVMHAASKEGLDVVMWSGVLNRRLPLTPAAAVTTRLMSQLRPGVIFDLHDGTNGHDDRPSWESLRSRQLARLPDFLDAAKAEGYRFVTLSELAKHADEASTTPDDDPDEQTVTPVTTDLGG